MKNIYLLLLLVTGASFAQVIEFEDEVLKQTLLGNTGTIVINDGNVSLIDTNGNNEIEVSEVENITQLDIVSTCVSIGGLEHFSSLIKLSIESPLTSPDFSNFQVLENLSIRNATSLDFTSQTLNSLVSLRINNVDNLVFVESAFPELFVCLLDNVVLSSFVINQASELDELTISNSVINEIQLDSPNLRILNLEDNTLQNFNITAPRLEGIVFKDDSLTVLDLDNCNSLGFFEIYSASLEILLLKTGSQFIFLQPIECPNLQYFCYDEINEPVFSISTYYDFEGVVLNSYCNYHLGGTNEININSFFDINNNGCIQDAVPFPYLKMELDNNYLPAPMNIMTTSLGSSFILVGEGTTQFDIIENEYFNYSVSEFSYNFPEEDTPVVQNICVSSSQNFHDLDVKIIPLSIPRPGFDVDYKISFKNLGTQTQSGYLTLQYDDEHTEILSSSLDYNQIDGSHLSWNFEDLQPFEQREIQVTLKLNTPTDPTNPLNSGDQLDIGAEIYPVDNDVDISNNQIGLKQEVVNSYDPNDKTCLEGNVVGEEMIGEYVHYKIRFENTGSSEAVNIVVKDIINTEMFDINSLKPIDASHSFQTRIKNTNQVEFIFENIMLPFDDANNDGYVVFKIKTSESLELGDTFENFAEIYFDYNYPIITNNEITSIAELLNINDVDFTEKINAYPNPFSDLISFSTSDNIKSIEIYNALGQLVKNVELIGSISEISLDMRNLPKGIYFAKIKGETKSSIQKLIKN